MPGIVGLITRKARRQAELELSEMMATMCHEPFYVSGTWIDESLGIYVGWVTRKNSFSDGMPLLNETEDVILVFSGEDFPAPGTVSRLKQHGHKLSAQSNSHLVHVYEEEPEFPESLNGRFQGLLVDQRQGTVTLFTDRYALQRVYYYEDQQAFYFAAEAKAILAVQPGLRTIDMRGLGEYLACGCVLENRTLFRGIQVLPPASKWVFRNASIEQKGRYFSPKQWEQQTPLEPEAYYHELREVFSRNLTRYFAGEEPIAMSLTGGLDTRMIMAWQKSAPGSLSCYSFGGISRESRDVTVARQVAAACGQPYEVLTIDSRFFSDYPTWAKNAIYVTDGCASVAHSADLYLNECARQIAPVRMTGNYGGEVLRRVRAFKPRQPAAELFDPGLTKYFRQASRTYADIADVNPLSFAVFRQAPWHHYGLLALEETKLSLRTPYLDNDLIRLVFRAPTSAWANEVCLRLIDEGNPALTKIITDRGLGGHDVPARARRVFLEFTFKAEYVYDYGMPQWLARVDRLLTPFRPERLFLGRHKFKHYRSWYRGSLSTYIKDILLDRHALSRPYLQAKTVEAMVQGHVRGDGNYTLELHQLLNLELINSTLLDAALTSSHVPIPAWKACK